MLLRLSATRLGLSASTVRLIEAVVAPASETPLSLKLCVRQGRHYQTLDAVNLSDPQSQTGTVGGQFELERLSGFQPE